MVKWKNQAAGTLGGNILAGDTSIPLSAGHGARFPATSSEDWFIATLRDSSNNLEIIYVQARTVDTLGTVVRGQDGTTARAYSTGDAIELRWANADVLGFQDDAVTGPTASGTDTYTANLRITPKAYNTGQVYAVNIANPNATPTPTLNLSAMGAKTIKRRGGIQVAVGDVNGLCMFAYDGTDMIIMNPAGGDEPPGTVAMTARATAPTGWLLIDGPTTASRTTDVALFTAIGTTYGVGDGATTFNLPPMSGRSPVGAGAGTGLTARAAAAVGGEETHVNTLAESAAHTHAVTGTTGGQSADHTHSYVQPSGQVAAYGTGGDPAVNNSGGGTTGGSSVDHTHALTGTTDSKGGGGAHNTMHPFLVMPFMIKR